MDGVQHYKLPVAEHHKTLLNKPRNSKTARVMHNGLMGRFVNHERIERLVSSIRFLESSVLQRGNRHTLLIQLRC